MTEAIKKNKLNPTFDLLSHLNSACLFAVQEIKENPVIKIKLNDKIITISVESSEAVV